MMACTLEAVIYTQKVVYVCVRACVCVSIVASACLKLMMVHRLLPQGCVVQSLLQAICNQDHLE